LMGEWLLVQNGVWGGKGSSSNRKVLGGTKGEGKKGNSKRGGGRKLGKKNSRINGGMRDGQREFSKGERLGGGRR